ncbi:MAG TPA: DUF6597 domain-containing transcriptional factor [Myxococcaceae bacterium]
MSALRYREVPPTPDLGWAVECFWFAEGPARGVERIVPDGCPELVVQLGGSMRAGDEGHELLAQPRALVVGQRSRALLGPGHEAPDGPPQCLERGATVALHPGEVRIHRRGPARHGAHRPRD